jgi:hypothetical protein
VRLKTISQEKGESHVMYLNRLRRLCQRTIPHADTPAEQAVLNREAERRLLAAFISGIRGSPGKHVSIQMSDTVDKDLNMAISAETQG